MILGVYYPFYIDYWYIVLVLPVLLLSVIIQLSMKSTFSRYSSIGTQCGTSGADMAKRVLSQSDIYGVSIECISGQLSDHYDPRSRSICLSRDVYSSNSIAAIGVACHEAGHAVQHNTSYMPLTLRNSLVPVVNFSSSISWIVIIAGIVMSFDILINVGIILFATSAFFQFITLPVELNASSRALKAIRDTGSFTEDEISGMRKVLTAAAMTYVAALALSIVSLLRVVLMTRGRGNRR